MAAFLKFPTKSHHFHPIKPSISPNSNFKNPSISSKTPNFSLSSSQSISPKTHLLNLISDQNRGLKTQENPNLRSQIIDAIDSLALLGSNSTTTDNSLSGTWRMLWTTEKEQLFIIKNAFLFGTITGDVLQVIDVENRMLNNEITFPPSGVFFVRSSIEIASNQRVNFRFTSAVLRGKDWEFPLPPFGQGWP
ncbi:hypothetical protein RND81_02G110600 [Saponaria officinalis]|uniref:Plastid lipid-associated protein/fibrillin conserved domain-containing protein n=1 Tax=Saponaria officinalis TaxID=3572 RepID=A0AAW1MLB0_SAPOF